jgi:cytochrome P450/nitrite reductase/ring-hydroxylating ferredoxin subunit
MSAAPPTTCPVLVAPSAALSRAGPHALSGNGVDVVVVRTPAGGVRAYQGHCPHQGALLGEGEIDGDALVCRNHRWRFSLENGKRQGGPQCLAAHPATERDGQVIVTVAAETGAAPAARGHRTFADLPGPRGLPLLGNLLQLDLDRLHQVLEGWAATYGSVYVYRLGRTPVAVVSDPQLSAQVLRARPETFRRLSDVAPVFAEMGVDGLFSAEGAAWRPQRRLAMEALSHRHLKGFYPTLRTVAERLRRRWTAMAGQVLDVADELKRFTVDVTTLLTFGHDVNTLEQGDDVIQRRLELVFPAFNRRLFALVPTWRFIRTPADRRLDRALAEIHTWLAGLVEKARAFHTVDPSRAESPSNFLEAMLAARDDEGRPFSDDVIMGNLMTMLLAGEDTTAYTLAWAVHHLCDDAAAAALLAQELDGALGAAGVPEDFETANRLAFAGAVANESMRLRPVAPMLFAEANLDTVVGDLHVPKGGVVAVLMRPAVREAGNFAAPDAFRPQRWLDAGEGPHEPSAHIPFGSGPRLCPGRTLALLEMKVVLATLYRSFRVERVGESAGVREKFAFTMLPVGLQVKLHPR